MEQIEVFLVVLFGEKNLLPSVSPLDNMVRKVRHSILATRAIDVLNYNAEIKLCQR